MDHGIACSTRAFGLEQHWSNRSGEGPLLQLTLNRVITGARPRAPEAELSMTGADRPALSPARRGDEG